MAFDRCSIKDYLLTYLDKRIFLRNEARLSSWSIVHLPFYSITPNTVLQWCWQ